MPRHAPLVRRIISWLPRIFESLALFAPLRFPLIRSYTKSTLERVRNPFISTRSSLNDRLSRVSSRRDDSSRSPAAYCRLAHLDSSHPLSELSIWLLKSNMMPLPDPSLSWRRSAILRPFCRAFPMTKHPDVLDGQARLLDRPREVCSIRLGLFQHLPDRPSSSAFRRLLIRRILLGQALDR
jgi:hypothetical protein